MDLYKRLCYIIINNVYKKWGGIIKKLKRRRKEWLDKKCRKTLRNRTAKNKQRRRNTGHSPKQFNNEYATIDKTKNRYTALAPKNLSIRDNYDETISYFNGIFLDMREKHVGRIYNFDIKDVKNLTNDALMYILAIVHNIKKRSVYNFGFEGNMPDDPEALRLFKESGFLNYMNTRVNSIEPTNEKLQIVSGKNTQSPSAKDIVDFARILKTKEQKRKLKALYRVLVELMSNTGTHAYNDTGIMRKNWYVFAEYIGDRIKFVFLDTGQGIPATMKRKGIRELLGWKSDEGLILATLKERFRSQTGQTNRGYGLPGTYKICKEGLLEKFTVISGRGRCEINVDEDRTIRLPKQIYGTLFYWEIS